MVSGRQAITAYGNFDFNSLAPNSAYDVTEMFSSKADALNSLMSLRQDDQAAENAARVLDSLPTVPGFDKAAYEMTSDEYFDALGETWVQMERIRRLYTDSTDEWGPTLSSEDRLIEERYNALYPPAIRALANLEMDDAYDAIMQVAKLAGAA
jgi:uncharacterized protein YegP (UPF0339 family)